MSNLKGLKCWLVHSGNAGDAVQCEGIAEKLGLDYKTIKVTDNTIIKAITPNVIPIMLVKEIKEINWFVFFKFVYLRAIQNS